MATDPIFDRPAAPAMGGTVEPANRATVAKDRFQTPVEKAGERFELRDPFAEVTYRANSLREMAAKAEQLGSSRFVAVGEDGKRTPVQKVDGEWQRDGRREPTFEPVKDRPGDRMPGRDKDFETTNVVPMPGTGKAPGQRGQGDGMALARMEAQAERAMRIAGLEAGLQERYVIKRAPVTVGDVTVGRTEYRFRGDTSRVAFTESTFRLATDTNSPSVARSMVDVAEARNWKTLRVAGNEDFKRMVWLEASVRGVKALGYEPNPGDMELLKREREARLVNRIEPSRDATSGAVAAPAEKAAARGGGGRKAVLAAVEAVLVAKKVPEKQRAAVMAAATEKLAQRTRDGQAPKVKVYDKAAPSQRPVAVPTPEMQRTRERAAPAPAR
jgi:Large polyvalent protein-associated domain 7